MNVFVERQLRHTFVLSGAGTFSNGSNTLQIAGLRSSARIDTKQYPAWPAAEIEIYGLLQADMNTLTDIQSHPKGTLYNAVLVEANTGNGWTTAYAGQIVAAQPNYQDASNVALTIMARTLYLETINAATPNSFGSGGGADVATMVSRIAALMGAQFQNVGVQQTLSGPYFPGTLGDQLCAIVAHANIDIFYDYGPVSKKISIPSNNPTTIIIAPKGTPRPSESITLTPNTGIVGYPSIDSFWGNIYARVLYNPGLKFGGQITLSGNAIPRTNGTFQIMQMTHTLQSAMPDGPWFTDLFLLAAGTQAPI